MRTTHRHHRPWAALFASLALLLGAAACGGDDDDGDAGSDSGGEAASVTVSVDDNFFEPEEVDIATGGTVTWEWVGTQPHNVVHDDFESELMTEGTFEYTFDEAGTYEYVCTVHPGMEGVINVAD